MAKKYIDAEKLKTEIERRMNKHWDNLPDADSPEDDWARNELCELGAYKELEHIEYFLNSLQQEQPEAEVDLEKEIDNYFLPIQPWQVQEEPFTSLEKCARHFYELGLKAKE